MRLTNWAGAWTSTTRKLLLVCAVLMVALPAGANERERSVRERGGGNGRAVYGSVYYGSAFGPWGAYGYDPFFYGAYPVMSHPNAGQVKVDTKVKDAEVFVNGAFAGTAKDFKSVWLRQGPYNLEVRSPGHQTYTARIYVLNGKTIRLRPDLRVEPKS